MPVFMVPLDEGRTIPLDKAIVLFGRNSDCDVVLTRSRKISRKHCCVAQVNNSYVIRDLGSLNGVWVNGERVRKQSRIRLGDEVSIGDVRYRLTDGKPAKKHESDGDETIQHHESVHQSIPNRIPTDLSQEIPIAIPDEDDDFVVESSSQRMADSVSDVDSWRGGQEDIPDDVLPLSDSGEFRDSGSHYKILSD